MIGRSMLAAAFAVAVSPAHALTPEELYAKLAPSIWFVYGMDSAEKRVSQGSGVVVGPQRVATNCHVIRGASTVFIRKENVLYIAKVEYRDPARDLCQLQVANLSAPAVEVGGSKDVRVGQKVFALGNPQGFEVSLSDGLVSALRGPDGKESIIQTTAPISQGSSGGGLFDEQGKLVGITTLQSRAGQNLNFAIPGEWITELAERTKAQAEEKKTQIAAVRATGVAFNPASPGLPTPGTLWKYRYRDLKYRNEQQYTVRVNGVDGWMVQESLSLDGGGSSQAQQSAIGAEELRFFARSLGASRTLIEFAPYLPATVDSLKQPMRVPVPVGYPKDRNTAEWKVNASITRNVSLRVPAGEQQTFRVDLKGYRAVSPELSAQAYEMGRFEVTAWYSLETRRLVRLQNRNWYGNNQPATDELVELIEYSGG